MSSRKLSSEEVDALMDGLKSSNHDVNADVSGSSDVRAFQFGQDDLSLMGDYYALRLINERFARIARGVFLPMLRVQPRISPFPPEVKSFDEYSFQPLPLLIMAGQFSSQIRNETNLPAPKNASLRSFIGA